MSWISIAAMYFVIWWLVLFAMLPFSLRTQEEADDVTLGTVPSAPQGPHMLWAIIRTTIVSAIIVGAYFGLSRGLGIGIDSIPRFMPEFG